MLALAGRSAELAERLAGEQADRRRADRRYKRLRGRLAAERAGDR